MVYYDSKKELSFDVMGFHVEDWNGVDGRGTCPLEVSVEDDPRLLYDLSALLSSRHCGWRLRVDYGIEE